MLNLELYGEGGISYLACAYMLSTYLFCEVPGDYECYCNNENARATVMGCLALSGSTKLGGKYLNNYCQKWYDLSLTEDELEESYQYYQGHATDPLASNPHFNSTSDNMTTPLAVNASQALLYRESYQIFLGNYDHSIYYGVGAVSYWFFIFLLAGVANWGFVLLPNLKNFFNGRVSRAWRRYITVPALWSRKRQTQQDFLGGFLSYLVPSRMESLILSVFFWLVFAMLIVEIRYLPNDPLFTAKKEAITRFVADRTGIIATMTVPLLILFGGRNNILQWLTRWSFASFITYHRWIARLMVAMAFVHSICFTALYVMDGIYFEEMAETYVVWGIVATTCGALICFQGLLFLRRAYYETFLVIHIVLAVFFVVGLWHHISVLNYPQLVYPIFAVWGVDRLVRVLRLFWFGFPLAKVELIADDAVKVTVPKPKHWKSIPGGHAWLHFALGWYFWQSHPFTFVEVEEKDGKAIVFYCKVKNGVTKKIGKKLANVPGRTLFMRVGVEGPYGEKSPVSRHSSVTYIAGGNGIPGIFAEALHLGRDVAKRTIINQKVKLVWILREAKSLSWFVNELKLMLTLPVKTTIYITRPDMQDGIEELHSALHKDSMEKVPHSTSSSKSVHSTDKDEEQELKVKVETDGIEIMEHLRLALPHVQVLEGRPELSQLIHKDVEEATSSAAFVTCGHPAMVDDVRYTVLQAMDKTEKRIDFYDQLQVWA